MSQRAAYDAVIVGSGPNGLAAAITLALAGRSVAVFEARETVGGGMRSAELTLPGFTHDVCSAIHPLGAASPFFSALPLDRYGLEWIHPPAPLAHPLPAGRAALLERSVAATAAGLGQPGGEDWRRLLEPLAHDWDVIARAFLGPLRPLALASHPLALGRFGMQALLPTTALARLRLRGEAARALLAGMAGHAMLPLGQPPSAAFALTLAASAHAVGWPIARGGSQRIADALAAYLRDLGGVIFTSAPIETLDALPAARAILCDVTPRQLLRLAGKRLPDGYARALRRYRYGPGVFKLDYALAGPIPWTNHACLRAGTVHVGGTLAEIAASERAVARGEIPERPLTLVAQQSLFDATRAPAGQQTLWAYCHVPHGSTVDMTARIEAQIERFAPGFRERVLARHVMGPAEMERYNPNYVGGDINGGLQDLGQLFTRPTLSLDPYQTPARNLYLCSSSTPPGGGVHGMCGYWAAQSALAGPLR
ncbi:MAG: NAD(P)/FAD-dependent oxidoreductase [Chloroflexota bacterium]|nr:NAD(P)/FAD-dependent oxidoreductase [Chloroflexota bacterium]